MKWIGLTGGIATGKSTVSQKLKEHHIPIIDADEVAKEIVKTSSPGLASIVKEFGEEILNADGSLDRRKLGERVFGQKVLLERLEAITHPLIRTEVQRRKQELENSNVRLAIYDIPLLFETKSEDQFDAIIVVTCHPDQQRERLSLRSLKEGQPLDATEIGKRIIAQIDLKIKEGKADFVIHNDGDENKLQKEIDLLLVWLKEQENKK
jgi:dephospho-CoA kinase